MIEDLGLRSLEKVFSDNLRELREARGLTQPAMAEALGIKDRTYQSYEAGVLPQELNRAKLADKLGVPETRLFLDSDLIETHDLRECVRRVSKAAISTLKKPAEPTAWDEELKPFQREGLPVLVEALRVCNDASDVDILLREVRSRVGLPIPTAEEK